MRAAARSLTTATLALAMIGTTGCGDDDGTGLEAEGRVSAAVTDANGASGALVAADQGLRPALEAAAFSGEFSGEMQVAISTDGSTWVSLGSPTRAELELQSTADTTQVHASAEVPAGAYTRVRIHIGNAWAVIRAGADLGGLVLGADATLQLGGQDGELIFEQQVQPFVVSADSESRVIIDLNSEQWADEENAQEEQVEDEEIEEACETEVEEQSTA